MGSATSKVWVCRRVSFLFRRDVKLAWRLPEPKHVSTSTSALHFVSIPAPESPTRWRTTRKRYEEQVRSCSSSRKTTTRSSSLPRSALRIACKIWEHRTHLSSAFWVRVAKSYGLRRCNVDSIWIHRPRCSTNGIGFKGIIHLPYLMWTAQSSSSMPS